MCFGLAGGCSEPLFITNERGKIEKHLCGRQLLKGSDKCIFHDPHAWRAHAKLMRKEIKEKINNGDLDFRKYHFPQIDFSEITKEFRKPVNFYQVVFHGDVSFNDIVFFSSARFDYAKFFGNAFFKFAKFSKGAIFHSAKFHKEASFTCATFSGKTTYFGECDYATAWFTDIGFNGHARLDGLRISGDARFDGSVFSGMVAFDFSIFSGTVTFEFCRFRDIVMFSEGMIADYSLAFRNAVIERAIDLDEEDWSKRGFHLKIEETDLALAADSYRALRQGLEKMGHYRIAGELYYREMTCRKNMIFLRNSITYSDSMRFPQWLRILARTLNKIKPLSPIFNRTTLLLKVRIRWSTLVNWLWTRLFYISCGFGERPSRVFLGCLFTVLVFTGIYFPIVGTSTNLWVRLKTAFLLSLDAFTPGRFLNISYASPGEWLVQVENVLGWFLLALALLVFTRKMSRS